MPHRHRCRRRRRLAVALGCASGAAVGQQLPGAGTRGAAAAACRRRADLCLRLPALLPIRADQLEQHRAALCLLCLLHVLRCLLCLLWWRQQQRAHLHCHAPILEVALVHRQACPNGRRDRKKEACRLQPLEELRAHMCVRDNAQPASRHALGNCSQRVRTAEQRSAAPLRGAVP